MGLAPRPSSGAGCCGIGGFLAAVTCGRGPAAPLRRAGFDECPCLELLGSPQRQAWRAHHAGVPAVRVCWAGGVGGPACLWSVCAMTLSCFRSVGGLEGWVAVLVRVL